MGSEEEHSREKNMCKDVERRAPGIFEERPWLCCTYQTPRIPTGAPGITSKVIKVSGTAFGFNFGSLLSLKPGHE